MNDFRALCQELMDAIDSGISIERIKQSLLALRVDAALAQTKTNTPTDRDLLDLLANHPLRTDIVIAAKEMAEYRQDASRGSRQVSMLVNVLDYAKLVLQTYRYPITPDSH